MSKCIHLYSGDSDLSTVTGDVGLLCEFAPDSPWIKSAEHCYQPDEILGSPDAALTGAYSLVSKLLQSAPIIEGLPLLSVFEEGLLEQVSHIVQAFHLDHWISSQGFSSCQFTSYSHWLDRLHQVRTISGSDYVLESDVSLLQTNLYTRAMRRLWNSRPLASEFFQRVAPLWSRYFSAVPRRKLRQNVPHGGIWFYSNAYNYTKIGLEYEAFLPQQLNFLAEDPATGGKRLRELNRDHYLLYAWSRVADIPSLSEVRLVGDRITSAVTAVALSDQENALRAVLLKSEWWRLFLKRGLPFALFNSRALQRWSRAVVPEMIVVGNAGDERVLLLHRNTEHIPTVMLQHGIMHWVYAVADQPVDKFLVRGPFFQRVLNEKLRRKTVIRNFPEARTSTLPQAGTARDSILFITTPYNVPVLFHPGDLRDIMRSLLRAAHSSDRPVVIRIHPLEKVSTYEQAVSELQQELGLRARVGYSQGPGVEEVLSRSCVAVLHFSTMFLDCLRHRIPMISFAWHWFPNKRQFEQEKIFNFASDLCGFETLIRQGIEGRLPVRQSELEEFLAPSQPEEVARVFGEIWESRRNVVHQAQ